MTQVYFRKFRTRGVYASVPAFRREIARTFQTKVGPGLSAANARQVSHWKVKPAFKVDHSMNSSGISVFVHPTGAASDLWNWHVQGVKGRVITPRRHRQPRYRMRAKGRSPRTKGRARRATRAALKFKGVGGEVVFRHRVFWKGIKPRPYPQNAAAEYKPVFYKEMKSAVSRAVTAARRAGS